MNEAGKMSYSSRVRQSLRRVEVFRDNLRPILRALEKIEWDRDRATEKFMTYGILDFRDLNRYLHPFLDLTAYEYPDRYYTEQLAIQYAITKRPVQLVLIDEYMFEYNFALRNAQIELAEFVLKADETTKERVISLDNALSRFLKEFQSGEFPANDAVVKRVAAIDLVMLDLLFDDMRLKIFEKGASEFTKLVESGAIIRAKDVGEIRGDDLKPERGESFARLNDAMERVRPGRKTTNETDAAAFHVIQTLNKEHFAKRTIFLYVTSARSVLNAFDSEYAISHVIDKGLYNAMNKVTVVRDPMYFLLRFLLEHERDIEGVLPFGQLLDLSRRFRDAAGALERYFGKAPTTYEIIDVEFQTKYQEACQLVEDLSPSIEAIKAVGIGHDSPHSLSAAVRSRLDLRPLLDDTKITDVLLRKRIDEALAEPRQLVDHFYANSQKLAVAIDSIEMGLVPIVFKLDKTDVIYRMTVSNPKDAELKEKAELIVDSLCKETLEDFRTAFRTLGSLRKKYPLMPDTLVLTSKVYRAVRAFWEALSYAQLAYDRAPDAMEVLFELCSCYTRLAVSEKNSALFLSAWEKCCEATEKSPDNPRLLKVRAYLLWRGFDGAWKLPEEYANKPLDHILSISQEAYRIAKRGSDHVLRTTIANDRSYYLCLTNDPVIISKQAIPLINEAIENVSSLELRRRGAYEDTKGFAKMLLYKLGGEKDKQLLTQAGKHIHAGYSKDSGNRTRQKHVEEWMGLWGKTA